MPYKNREDRKKSEQRYERSEKARLTRNKYKKSDAGVEVRKKVYKKSYLKLRKNGYYLYGAGAYKRLKDSSVSRGMFHFPLTRDELRDWWLNTKDCCYYCGMSVETFVYLRDFIIGYAGTNYEISKYKTFFKAHTHKKIENMTVDRLDNSETYAISNMVKACWFCNCIKGAILSADQYRPMASELMGKLQKHVELCKDEWCGPGIKIVPKGWGREEWIHNNKDFCGKRLIFDKGKRCSFHYHICKDEVFFLDSGKVLVKYSQTDDLDAAEEAILKPHDNFNVYPGLRHQIIALEDSVVMEFSTTHRDDDSIRVVKGD